MWRRRGHRFLRRFVAAVFVLALFAFAFFALAGWFAASWFGGPPVGRPPFGGPHGGPFFPPFGFLFFILLGIGLIAAARSLRRMTVPVAGIMEAAGRVAQGDYAARVREWGPPEVRSLARAFNEMTERLQAHEEQRRTLLAEVTHELRTPLAVIQGNLEGLLDGVYPRDDGHLAPILEEARVLATLVEDLRTLALAETGTLALHRESIDLGTLIEETLAAYRPRADEQNVALRSEVEDDLPVMDVDPTRIRQVLASVLTNALTNTPAGGEVRVTVRQVPRGGAVGVAISVADTGRGIAPEHLPHIFERFYRASGSGGTGLGLTIARNLVVLHGGEITAESEVGKGTVIRITL